MKRSLRGGFSLLEVVLATAILLGCVIVLSQIAFVGRSHMEDADQLTIAQLACQTRIHEMLSGAAPVQAVHGEPIAELPGWGLTVRIDSTGQTGLFALRVTAAQVSAADSETGGTAGRQFVLTRWFAAPGAALAADSDDDSPGSDLPLEADTFDQPPLRDEPAFFDESPWPDGQPLPEY